jgi:hypothetical protein
MNDEPSVKEMVALWKLCFNFVQKHKISCPEATVNDWVYENAPDLVESICEEVGYYEEDE